MNDQASHVSGHSLAGMAGRFKRFPANGIQFGESGTDDMMFILGNQKVIETEFANEQEIEDVVVANAEYFFGPSSIFIPRNLIRTKGGL